ncbi:MAG: class I SAM-dependent methyltransferase [Streptosporangiaceae bacterium]
MTERAYGKAVTPRDVAQETVEAFWRRENLRFAEPHYRLVKAARIIDKLARGRECSLLDIGCGPATVGSIVPANVDYYGIDIAIQDPAPNLLEADLRDTPISFDGKRFDIVLAQGFFEDVGDTQSQKLAEIAEILNYGGKFIVSYWNFGHRKPLIYQAFSNVQSLDSFRTDLARYFKIDRSFPAAHNWRHAGPSRRITRALNVPININIPLVSPTLAVEYFFICSPRQLD